MAKTPTPVKDHDEPTPSNPPATVQGNPLAHFGNDLERYAGAGTSSRPEDNVIPFLRVLGDLSPQCRERDSAYVRGAKPGMLYNTSTGRLYDVEGGKDGILAVQGFMEVSEIEWKPNRAGFVAKHPLNTPLVHQVQEIVNPQRPNGAKVRQLPNGNQLVLTAEHYIILKDTLEPCVVSLSSTGLAVHRKWNSIYTNKKIRGASGKLFTPPSFATVVRLTTVYVTRGDDSWFQLAVEDMGWLDGNSPDAFEAGQEVYERAIAGDLKTAPRDDGSAADEPPTIDGRPSYGADDEVPF